MSILSPHSKYLMAALPTVPVLPFMYAQAIQIKRSVPKLPPATDPSGLVQVAGNAPTRRILFLGESTVAGVGVKTHAEGFAGTMARELAESWQAPVDWKVYARNGYTAAMVRRQLLPLIEETTANWIIVGLGANDAFGLHSPARWKKDVVALIEDLQERFPATPIAFTNMPPIKIFPAFTPLIKWTIGNLVEWLGDTLEQVSASYPTVYYNAERIHFSTWQERHGVSGEVSRFFSDGIHPSQLTYQVWAKDMARFITKVEK